MDKLVAALGPAFAAGFAVQRLLEILDPLLDKVKLVKDNKKIIMGVISLVVGFALALGIGVRVLQPLGVANADVVDVIVTALIVSAGTEGFNSIMKFLGYAKEDKKADTVEKQAKVEPAALDELQKAV